MKERLDIFLVKHNYVESREKAKAIIMTGAVLIDNEPALKASQMIRETSEVRIRGKQLKYVSRAGLKLEKALKEFNINVSGLTCLDVGSSTGGFTDCLLQSGAKFVYALDVGTNQLDWKIRNNPQVKSMEQTNFRYCNQNNFNNPIEFMCVDVSFISITKIISTAKNILLDNHYGVFLIKPQFEASKPEISKGAIKSPLIQIEIIYNLLKAFNRENFACINLDFSPILGNKKRNIEFIIQVQKKKNNAQIDNNFDITHIEKIVNSAWKTLLI